jgi:multidrug efflux pump subunit AcrB
MAQIRPIKLNVTTPFAGIILLLVWQFNSFRRAAIILLTIPLMFIGATLGLIIMNSVFGFMVILGLLSLAGIIINNGIVLIDRIDVECQRRSKVRPAHRSKSRPLSVAVC